MSGQLYDNIIKWKKIDPADANTIFRTVEAKMPKGCQNVTTVLTENFDEELKISARKDTAGKLDSIGC